MKISQKYVIILCFAINKQQSYPSFVMLVIGGNISPAVAFSPAQDHQIELPIPLIDQVPCVPAKEDSLFVCLTPRSYIMCPLLLSHSRLKGFKGVQSRGGLWEAFARKDSGNGKCGLNVWGKMRHVLLMND